MIRISILKETTICAVCAAFLFSTSVKAAAVETRITEPSTGISISLEQFYETEKEIKEPFNTDTKETHRVSISDIAITSAIQTREDTAAQKEKEAALREKYEDTGIAQVNEFLNIRQSPELDSKVVGKLENNAGCEILKTKKDGWVKIESGEVTGYVQKKFLLTGDEVLAVVEKVSKEVAKVETPILNVREDPSKKSDILTLVSEGDHYPIYKTGDVWIQIGVDSKKGWVKKEFVTVSKELKTAEPVVAETSAAKTSVSPYIGDSTKGQSIASYAAQFVGNPYVWGGTSLRNGADCSGFVLSVFSHFGYSLNRNSAAQASNGTRIPVSEVRPGDLLFYGSGSISHVGIYIGNGQIVHASNARTGIKISNSNYRSPICATRIVN